MKKFFYTVLALAVFATACQKENGPKVKPVGDELTLGAKIGKIYSRGLQGWIAADRIGVFVSAADGDLNNLEYKSKDVATEAPNEYLPEYTDFTETEGSVGTASLEAVTGEKATFTSGAHAIYAYTPYNEESADYTKVVLPDLNNQEVCPYNVSGPYHNYTFAYTKTVVEEYSVAMVDLGEMVTPFSQITVPSLACSADLANKTVTKMVVSCEEPLAYEAGATINLETGEITGEPVYSLTMDLEGQEATISEGLPDWGVPPALTKTVYLVAAIPFDVAAEQTFTVTITVDGAEYSTSGPMSTMMISPNNVNLYGLPEVAAK